MCGQTFSLETRVGFCGLAKDTKTCKGLTRRSPASLAVLAAELAGDAGMVGWQYKTMLGYRS